MPRVSSCSISACCRSSATNRNRPCVRPREYSACVHMIIALFVSVKPGLCQLRPRTWNRTSRPCIVHRPERRRYTRGRAGHAVGRGSTTNAWRLAGGRQQWLEHEQGRAHARHSSPDRGRPRSVPNRPELSARRRSGHRGCCASVIRSRGNPAGRRNAPGRGPDGPAHARHRGRGGDAADPRP